MVRSLIATLLLCFQVCQMQILFSRTQDCTVERWTSENDLLASNFDAGVLQMETARGAWRDYSTIESSDKASRH